MTYLTDVEGDILPPLTLAGIAGASNLTIGHSCFIGRA